MKKVCILLVLIINAYHNARFKKRKDVTSQTDAILSVVRIQFSHNKFCSNKKNCLVKGVM